MQTEVLCWNCSVKTSYGFCHNCGKAIVDNSITTEEKEEVQSEQYRDYLEPTNPDYFFVMYFLIGMNILFFLFTTILSGSVGLSNEMWTLLGSSSVALDERRYYVLITSMFVHGDPLHLFFNMYWLAYLAARLGQFGYSNTGLFLSYITIGIIAGYLTAEIAIWSVSVGASAAVFGWIGIYIAILRRRGVPEWSRYRDYALIYLAISFILPFISFWGHLLGFALGWGIGSSSVFDYFKKS